MAVQIQSDKETVAMVMEAAVKADGRKAGVSFYKVPDDPRRRVIKFNHIHGQEEVLEIPEGPRTYTAGTVEDVAALVNRIKTRDGAPTSDTFVWVDGGEVAAVLTEQGDRRERVKLALSKSSSFKILEDLAGDRPQHGNVEGAPGWWDQRGIVDLLRNKMAASYEPSDVITLLRQLKIDNASGGESSLNVGKESISKRAIASVTGLDGRELPDRITVTVPVYDDWFEPTKEGQRGVRPRMAQVVCAFDVELQRGVFRLKPLAGQVERVLLDVDNEIVERLRQVLKPEANAHVFLGAG